MAPTALAALFITTAWFVAKPDAVSARFALVVEKDAFEPSILDCSRFVEAPTGKHGFVTRKGDRFVFQDGTAARFWGAQMELWSKEQTDYAVRRMRKQGINLVRLHGLTFLNARHGRSILEYAPNAFDRLDYAVSQLGANGIYIILDTDYPLITQFGPDDKIPGLEQGGPAQHVEFFNDRAAELKHQRMKDVFTHLNPYTKRRYADDPTLALIEIQNEDSMFWYSVDSIPEIQKQELTSKYGKWLRAKYGAASPELVSLIPVGSFRESTLQKHPDWKGPAQDQMRFYLELEEKFWSDSMKILRDAGVRVPITGTNWQGGGFTTRVHMFGQSKLDYIDRHGYWDHPQGEGNTKWQIKKCLFHNLPMVKALATGQDPQQENNVGNLVIAKAWERVMGMPMTISEWNTCLPNQQSLEGTGIMAAYGMMQGWNGLLEFGYFSPDWPGQVGPGSFDMLGNPAQILQFPAVAAMWYRGDVREGEEVASLSYTPEQVFDFAADRMPVASAAALVGKVGYRFGSEPAVLARDVLREHWDGINRVATSTTGELTWDASKGLVSINTRRTQALIGFLSSQPRASLQSVEIASTSHFGAIYVTAMDGDAPVSSARHILITAVGPSRNSGMEYEPTSRMAEKYNSPLWHLKSPGQPPVLQDAIAGTVRIRSTAPTLQAWALDINGRRRQSVPLRHVDGDVILALDAAPATVYYEISAP